MVVRKGETLARYMQRVFTDLERNDDTLKAIRRLNIKKVHLQRKGDVKGLDIIKKTGRLLEWPSRNGR